jgi:hypothetical protein
MEDKLVEPTKFVDFRFEYTNIDNEPAKLVHTIEIPYRESIGELVHQIIAEKMDPLMKFMKVDQDLVGQLEKFIEYENQRFYDEKDELLLEKIKSRKLCADTIALETDKLYKDEILEFAERIGPSDEEIFAQSFHQLVHSSKLTEILEKEKNYAKTIAELTNQMANQIMTMNTLHQEEIDSKMKLLDVSVTPENINQVLAKQYDMQSMIRKQCEWELESTREQQKHEYRNWITTNLAESLMNEGAKATQIGNRWSMISAQGPSMEESFTIHLGSQLKHMHNIRIMSAKIAELCSPLYSDNSCSGPSVALGLYSSSLSGIVVLTPTGTVKPISEIYKNANMSTEFHFHQIDRQMDKIRNDLENLCEMSDRVKLKPGDVFITRHSNLAHNHVIFHLVSDETNSDEINSRHPVILGLRNILKIASRHDLTTLTIPAFLRHEMCEDMTVNWCLRRAELVFKCMKGFMIESGSWGGSELR